MRGLMKIGIGLLILLIVAIVGIGLLVQRGFSARAEPSALESFAAKKLRHLSVPRSERDMKNPVTLTPVVLTEGRAHFADHCAVCHGNDGRGKSVIGQGLYPKVPDMWAKETQSLSDGELFYIIRNGIRLSGMPAWGDGPPEEDQESWHLVHFIRHLPQITVEEMAQMRDLNPKTRAEWEEEEQKKDFLDGENVRPVPKEHGAHKH